MSKGFVLIMAAWFLAGCGTNDVQAGKNHFRSGRHPEAIDSFTKAIQSDAANQEAHFFRGATFSAMGQFDRAIEDYTKAIELNPQHTEAYWSRGYCYANAGKFDQAIADYTRSLELGTNMKVLVRELRAKVYFRKSMWNEAEADLKTVLQMEPGNSNALAGLREVEKAKSDPNFDAALKFRPIEEQPEYGGIPSTPEMQRAHDQFIQTMIQSKGTRELACRDALKLGWSFYKQGDYSTAMKRFNQAWLLDKSNPEIFWGYSKVLKAWGHTNAAERWEQKARAGGYQDGGFGSIPDGTIAVQ